MERRAGHLLPACLSAAIGHATAEARIHLPYSPPCMCVNEICTCGVWLVCVCVSAGSTLCRACVKTVSSLAGDAAGGSEMPRQSERGRERERFMIVGERESRERGKVVFVFLFNQGGRAVARLMSYPHLYMTHRKRRTKVWIALPYCYFDIQSLQICSHRCLSLQQGGS